MNHAEFLTAHKDVLDFLQQEIVGQLKDARRWSAFGMLWQAAIQESWWGDFISDRMLELNRVSDIFIKHKMSDFIKYICHPQLFAVGLTEYLNKHIGTIVAPTNIQDN